MTVSRDTLNLAHHHWKTYYGHDRGLWVMAQRPLADRVFKARFQFDPEERQVWILELPPKASDLEEIQEPGEVWALPTPNSLVWAFEGAPPGWPKTVRLG